jgi:hypothetical protein
LLERLWVDGAPAADLSVLGLPPLRREWTDIGLMPPLPTLRLIAVVPLVLAVNRDFAPLVRDWEDLRPLLREPGRIGVPPLDTPLPFLLSAFLAARWGLPEADIRAAFDSQSPPLEINKRLGRGELAVGLLPPIFCRNFREGDAAMVWPESGALAVPVMAAMAPQAPAASVISAPAAAYCSSASPLPRPAPASTRTVCPRRTRVSTAPGVMDTRFSNVLISFGIPMIIMLSTQQFSIMYPPDPAATA